MKTDTSKYDWNKSDAELAEIHGITRQAINQKRKKYGFARTLPDWESVDWSKSNNQIAHETGYSRGYIAEKRWRLQKGSSESVKEAKVPAWAAAKLSERKTVHQWLNQLGIPDHENGKPLCLLRRLAVALKIHD